MVISTASAGEDSVVVHIEDTSLTNAGSGSFSIYAGSCTSITEEPPPAHAFCFRKRVCKWFWIVKRISYLVFAGCIISIVVCSITDGQYEIAQLLFMICIVKVAILTALYYAYKMWNLQDTMLKVLLLEMILLGVLSYFIKLEKYHNLTPFVQGFLLAFVLGAPALMSLHSRKKEKLRVSSITLEALEEKIKLMEVEKAELKEELAKVKVENENLINYTTKRQTKEQPERNNDWGIYKSCDSVQYRVKDD